MKSLQPSEGYLIYIAVPMQFELPMFDFDIYELNLRAAERVGKKGEPAPEVLIVEMIDLGDIDQSKSPNEILLHGLLNMWWMPEWVMEKLLIHMHIRRSIPQQREDRNKAKPWRQRFRAAEKRLGVECATAWERVYQELEPFLEPTRECDATQVQQGWNYNPDRGYRGPGGYAALWNRGPPGVDW